MTLLTFSILCIVVAVILKIVTIIMERKDKEIAAAYLEMKKERENKT